MNDENPAVNWLYLWTVINNLKMIHAMFNEKDTHDFMIID